MAAYTDPATNYSAITPGTPFAQCRSIYVGTAGTVVAILGSSTATFTCEVGVLPVMATNVTTDSTADGLVALY